MKPEIEQRIEFHKIDSPRREVSLQMRLGPKLPQYQRELNQIVRGNMAARSRVRKIWNIADRLAADLHPDAPCTSGCNGCCHLAVQITDLEAKVIGDSIGRPPADPPPTARAPSINDFSRETPCTFLQNGLCSIYDHRPLECRLANILDVDSLLCQPENWDEVTGIPKFRWSPILYAFSSIEGARRALDIRQWFPEKI